MGSRRPQLADANFQRRDLSAPLALHLQHAGQLGEDEFLAGGDALLQFFGRDDDQPPRLALGGLAVVIRGRGEEGDLAARRQLQPGKFPAVGEDHRLRRPGLVGQPADVRRLDGAGPVGRRQDFRGRLLGPVGAAHHQPDTAQRQVVVGPIPSGTTAWGVTTRFDVGRWMMTVGGKSGTAVISPWSSTPPTRPAASVSSNQ